MKILFCKSAYKTTIKTTNHSTNLYRIAKKISLNFPNLEDHDRYFLKGSCSSSKYGKRYTKIYD